MLFLNQHHIISHIGKGGEYLQVTDHLLQKAVKLLTCRYYNLDRWGNCAISSVPKRINRAG